MAKWIALLEQAQEFRNLGLPDKASDIYRQGLKIYAGDASAVQWLTFNLMQSDAVTNGPAVAKTYLPSILASGIPWEAKLYTMEFALAGALISDSNLTQLYESVCQGISEYTKARHTPADLNVMSCQAITRHIYRLIDAAKVDPLFKYNANEDRFPSVHAFEGIPSNPLQDFHYNRLPEVIRINKSIRPQPKRPLGFRSVGKAYLARLGNSTVLFDQNGTTLETPYGAYPAFLKTVLEKIFQSLAPRQKLSGASLFIGDYFSQVPNYCHWIFDNLPRLVAARHVGLVLDNVIGSFENTQHFQTDSLTRLLNSGEKYLSFSSADGLVEFENLYYADNASVEYLNHPLFGGDKMLTEELRARFMPQSSAPPTRKLYVPRRKSRHVLNESETLSLLAEYGFESIDTDTLTFDEQVEAFSSARVVVAPHGAALTNILFMPAGGKILEFFPCFGGSASFYLASSAIGLEYNCYIDDMSNGLNRDTPNGIIDNNSPITVDQSYLRSWLNENVGTP